MITALIQLGIGFLGLGAIAWALFSHILPGVDLPDWSIPDWLESILAIPRWILNLPDRSLEPVVNRVRDVGWWPGLSWLKDDLIPWLQDVRIWIPVLVAVGIAFREVQRRKRGTGNETSGDRATNADQAERR